MLISTVLLVLLGLGSNAHFWLPWPVHIETNIQELGNIQKACTCTTCHTHWVTAHYTKNKRSLQTSLLPLCAHTVQSQWSTHLPDEVQTKWDRQTKRVLYLVYNSRIIIADSIQCKLRRCWNHWSEVCGDNWGLTRTPLIAHSSKSPKRYLLSSFPAM